MSFRRLKTTKIMEVRMNKSHSFVMLIIALMIVITVFSGCSMVPIPMKASYQPMFEMRKSDERLIDTVSFDGSDIVNCGHQNHGSRNRLQISGYSVLESQAANAKHPVEGQLDRLLIEAKKKYPNDPIEIRNVTDGYESRGTKQANVQGQTQTQRICRRVIMGEVVTSQPMPSAINRTENITGNMTRADTYRRTHNYLSDTNHRSDTANVGNQAVKIDQANLELGRIRATYTFNVESGEQYLITTVFTMDAHDSKAELSFANATLQRFVVSSSSLGGGDLRMQQTSLSAPEPIFLQSVADLARAEIVRFSDALVSAISR